MICTDFIYIKDLCETPPQGGLSINDFVDFSVSRLAKLSGILEPTAKEVASNLLKVSINDAISKVSTLNTSFNFNSNVLEIKRDYGFTVSPILSDNLFTILSTKKDSTLLKQNLVGIIMQPLFDGDFTITVTDGEKSEAITFVGENGVPKNYEFEFQSYKKEIIITVQSGLYFNMVSGSSGESGCTSCGGGKTYEYFTKSIWNGTGYNYPLIGVPQSHLMCDSENMLCLLLLNARFRYEFTRLVAYIFIANMYRKALLSERTNSATFDKDAIEKDLSMFIDTEKNGIVRQGLINDVLIGNKTNAGLLKILKENMQNSRDYCILCSQKVNKVNMHT